MRRNKLTIKTKADTENSNELEGQNNDAAAVATAPGSVDDKDYHDRIDHCQAEQQQVGLLASEFTEEQRTTRTISSRLSALVPNIMVKSHHQKSFDSVPAEAQNTTTAAKAMQKMLQEGDNNSARQSGDVVDLESNEKRSRRWCSKSCCYSIALMALVVVGIFVGFYILSKPAVLSKEDTCHDEKGSFQNYKLFATKTLYTSAFNYINKSPQPTSDHQPSNHKHHDDYDKNPGKMPDIFSSSASLESTHQELLSKHGCKLVKFHLFKRHAARTPDSEDIAKLNQLIDNIKSRIDFSKFMPALSSDQESSANNSEVVCHGPMYQLREWKNFLSPEQGNLVTEFGFQESEAIANRLKRIYPEIFDGNMADIHFGTTQELRTAQTAISFLKQMANPPNGFCELNQYPAPNTVDKAKAEEIRQDSCFKQFLDQHQVKNLSFHKTCKEYKEGDRFGFTFNLSDDARTQFIADYVSSRLQLTGQNMLTPKETRAIYDLCRYETAQHGNTSIWCQFFRKSDLLFYEYLSDISDFYNDAYGQTELYQSTCAVTRDLLKSYKDTRSKLKGLQISNQKPEAYFYFTHSAVIQRMIAASVDLRKDSGYSQETIKRNLASQEVPETREWRSSLFSPFSANIAFTLYHCPAFKDEKGDNSEEMSFDVSPLKVVVSLNEQPIKIDGCSSPVCDLNTLDLKTRLFRDSSSCDLESICRPNYVVT
jgi:hypothetical protein